MHTSSMDLHGGNWHSDISSFPTGEESFFVGPSKKLKLSKAQPPKKLLLSRSSARPKSYAAAATSDTASPSFSPCNCTTIITTTPLPHLQSASPPLTPLLTSPTPSLPPPLCSAEKFPRTARPQSSFKLGMIIEAPLIEEDFMYGASLRRATAAASASGNGNSPKAQRNILSISASHYGYIHTKLRKFVVVGLFAQHYVAVPMYTHNGEGLDRKPDKNEYASVRDGRSGEGTGAMMRGVERLEAEEAEVIEEEEERERALKGHEVLVAEMWPEASRLYDKTTVHIAYAISRSYQLKVHYCGDLAAGSRTRLLERFQEYMIRGTLDAEQNDRSNVG